MPWTSSNLFFPLISRNIGCHSQRMIVSDHTQTRSLSYETILKIAALTHYCTHYSPDIFSSLQPVFCFICTKIKMDNYKAIFSSLRSLTSFLFPSRLSPPPPQIFPLYWKVKIKHFSTGSQRLCLLSAFSQPPVSLLNTSSESFSSFIVMYFFWPRSA